MFDINRLLSELGQRTCGPDLEYDADYIALEKASATGEDVQYGEHLYPAQAVDWKQVEALSLALLERTQDLRVAVWLARARLEQHGLKGLTEGLRVVAYLLCERWEEVHPQLLADEQFDPLMRLNVLAELAVPATIMVRLRREPLATAADGQTLFLKDLEFLTATESHERNEKLMLLGRLIEPQCSPDLLRSLSRLDALARLIGEVDDCLDSKAITLGGSPLQPLGQSLRQWQRTLQQRLGNSIPIAALPDIAAQAVLLRNPTSSSVWSGACESREEVIRALDAVCSYYQRHEPTSPVPLLAGRARRLVGMNFLDLIEELAPASLDDFRALGGSAAE